MRNLCRFIGLLVCIGPIIGCGGSTDPCRCPSADTLTEENIIRPFARDSFYISTEFGWTMGWLAGCQRLGSHLIAGGCMLEDVPDSVLSLQGFYVDPTVPDWECQWTMGQGTNLLTIKTTCIVPHEPEPLPSDPSCDCPPVEPIQDRVKRIKRGGQLLGQEPKTIVSTCDGPDDVLISGGCSGEGDSGDSARLRLVSTGPTADGTGWTCTTYHTDPAADTQPIATAACIRPPSPNTAPEAVPLRDRINMVTTTATLVANDILITDATCNPGDMLIMGGCQLDDPENQIGVTMFRTGYAPEPDNRPDTWQCGWKSTKDTDSQATVTAICLEPLSEPT